ncbi:PREDICTED: serine/threonine receptor-like kinase NFP [Ipomoea nil]|uniref:serine/threonine receptor-like kinase NFP n=1 Tax=Ipomoea nil TaxID=35883 RepID=UPI0009019476|nr:PREDICTED: serine/threonine receptor-like kinase NFP [Ipomoea nil]
MKISYNPIAAFLIFFFFFFFNLSQHYAQAQPNTTGYACNINQSYPCKTYAFYTATAPNFLDLAAIGDLFSVSRRMIAEASNISAANATLQANQSLFIPISCSCNTVNSTFGSISYAPLDHTIVPGDTFYRVSTLEYGDLTSFQSAIVVNPTAVVTDLQPGDHITFPIFCKCPNSTDLQNRRNLLITYPVQVSDTPATIAAKFGTTTQSLIDVNGNNIGPNSTIFVPVSRLPNITQPATSAPAPPPPPAVSQVVRNRDRKGAVIALAILLGVCVALLVGVIGFWVYREKKREKERGKYADVATKESEFGKNKESSVVKDMEVNLMADVSDCLDKYKVYTMEQLWEATDGFNDNCLIQGSVYKGSIDGDMLAIKKLKWNAREELKILQKVNHGSLVKLEGFCIDPKEANCYLVYEYVENGSLHSWLHGGDRSEKLSWKTRLSIATDVANGLQYIHEHTRPRVIHKDIKSSNILLDAAMRAKIANFGLAKSGCNAITMHIVGTQGYISPEYLADGVVSTKMDVFAFGVVLLELITGQEAMDADGRALWGKALAGPGAAKGSEERKAAQVREWMDPCLARESCSMESVSNVMAVAVACLNKDPSKRPTMVDIVYALSKSNDLFFDVSDDGLSSGPVTAR